MMDLKIKNIDENLAKQILGWRYDKPYDFYNNPVNDDGMKEMLDGSYRVLFDKKGEVFGFFCTGKAARIPIGHQHGVYKENGIDIGLGMNPDQVGKGMGYDFCRFIIKYIEKQNEGVPIRLSVAAFNKRAIHLYEKIGFVKTASFTTDSADFLTMIKE
ncbi:GNAT family N-acetyltransferase [Amphibacillus sp. Q70]|uniref:GNAT family N-acetyltransferase n=1 Tax=Amphibacillus sp. Q70 TaxID=3453416 RepID=UPI003F82A91C